MSFDKLKILNEREKARDKLPTFYGSRSNYYHAFREVGLNNTIDEIENNFEYGELYITLHDDLQTLTIRDTGRGMPIQKETNGVPNWQIFFTILFASGKYEANQTNSGLNGVGSTVANYTSEFYKVKVWHNGEEYEMSFEDGGYVDVPVTFVGKTDKHGTEISFKLDDECYENTIYNPNEIEKMIRIILAVSNKTTCYYAYNNETKVIKYENMNEYFKDNFIELVSNIITFDKKTFDDIEEETSVELVLAASKEPSNEALLNRNHLVKKGTINEGVLKGLRTFLHKYIQEKGLYDKKEKTITSSDVENSISFIASVTSNNPEFEGQTKFATEKKLYESIVQKYIQEKMEIFKIENQVELDKMVNQLLITKRANERAENSRKNIKKILEEKVSVISKIPNLIECKSKDRDKNILCICEGQSALGSLLSGRRDVHALFPLRGKVLNCLKSSPEKIFANDVVLGLQRALGCGVEFRTKHNKDLNSFNKNNLRYSKIYIMVDQDFDGIGSIMPLLLSMFQVLNPTLVKEGYIYICETPKYEITCGKEEYFAINDEELNVLLKKLEGSKYKINYIKGLAELSANAMALCLSEGYKNITQVTLNDIDKSLNMLDLFMGKDIQTRKDFILNNF